MKNLLLLLLFILLSVCGQNQELVFEKEMGFSKNIEMFPIYFQSGDSLAILLQGKTNLQLTIINNELFPIVEKSIEYNFKDFPEFLGSVIVKENIFLYFLSKNEKQIMVVDFNIASKEIETELVEYQESKERFVASFEDAGRLLVITSSKKQSEIIVYAFKGGMGHKANKYSFEGSIYTANSYLYTLDELLKRGKKSTKIENSGHINIEDAAKKTKLYYENEQIIITIDIYGLDTRLIVLNLDDGSKKEINIRSNIMYSEYLSTNSFIFKKYLYQFSRNGKEEWKLSKYDYRNDSLLNAQTIDFMNFSSFVNSYVRFPGGMLEYISYNELEPKKVKSLYRKISRYDPVVFVSGISGDSIQLIVGGYKYQSQAGAMGAAPGGGGGMTMYGSGGTNFIYECFSTILDRNSFSHLPGKLENDLYESISDYGIKLEKEIIISDDDFLLYKNHLSAKKVFLFNNEYYLGYYLKEDKKYYLYRFGDSVNE